MDATSKSLPESLSPAMDWRLWAEVCECPIEDKAMLHLLLASRLYKRSHGGGRSFPVIREDFGSVW